MTSIETGTTEQERLIAALAAPGGLGPEAAERVDTHLSTILLSGDRAYKAMRAVRYDFVDFTALAERRRACEQEVAANIAAPDLYLGAVPVIATDDGPRLGDEADAARAVEWLVEMRRFDRALEFDRLLARGALERRTIEALADVVAQMHADAPERPDAPVAASARNVIDDCARALTNGPDDALAARAQDWAQRARAVLDARTETLEERRRSGRCRRCHGDLHLGNICLFDGRPTPFDAIVFSDRLTEIDVLYDVGFTVMDLLYRGAPALANAFLSRYLSATRDYGGLGLLAFFVSLRAAVRAMIDALPGDWDGAMAHLDLAERCLTERSLTETAAPRLVAIGGASGTGKSTLGRALAPDLAPLWGAVTLRSDVARKRLLGLPPEARAPEASYTQEMSDKVYASMMADALAALRCGATVLLDAAFLKGRERAAAAALAEQAGARFDGLWLDADLETRRERVAARRGDASDATAAVAEAQSAEPLTEDGWRELDAARTPEATLAAARRALGI